MAEQVPANSPSRTTLSADALATDFALHVTSGAGFGTTGTRRAMLWTEDGSGNVTAFEYVLISSRTGTTLTVPGGGRGVEGTAAQSWTAAAPTYIAEILTNAGLSALISEAVAPKMVNPMTTTGDMIRATGSGVPVRIPIGADGQVLTVVSSQPAWAAASGGFANPMTTAGDLIVGGAAGAAARLAKGADGQVLTVDPTTHLLVWATSPAGFADPLTTKGDLIVRSVSATGRLPVGADGQVLTADAASANGLHWATPSGGGGGGGGSGLYNAYVHIRDERASGTNGGDYTTGGTWQTRPLQTEKADSAGIAGVASNQITLAAGTYHVQARGTTQFSGPARLRLRDITNGATLVLGDSSGDNVGGGGYTQSDPLELSGRFTLAATTVIELQMWATYSRATYGLGAAVSTGDVEVFASVELWREGSGGGSVGSGYTPPNPAAFGWENQNGATLLVGSNVIAIYKALVGNGTLCAYGKAIPHANPWYADLGIMPSLVTAIGTGSRGVGIYLRDSTSGRLTLLSFWDDGLHRVDHLNSFSSFNAAILSSVQWAYDPLPAFFRIADDGTNLTIKSLFDRVNPMPYYSEGRTAWLTNGASHYGFFIFDNTSSNSHAQISLLHHVEA